MIRRECIRRRLVTIGSIAMWLVVAATLANCTPVGSPVTLVPTLEGVIPTQVIEHTPTPSATPEATATLSTVATVTATSAAGPTATPAPTQGTTLPTYSSPPTGIPSGVLPPEQPLGSYLALAWNDLGMHCIQPDYTLFAILPPYNNLWTQIISRGGEDPRIVTQGLTVDYSVPEVTHPQDFTNFWQYASAYGWDVTPGFGLTGKGTSGTMDAAGDHFTAEGVPLIDRDNDGTFDPYPFFVVDVKSGGQTVVQTVNVAPISTEMHCDFCHAAGTPNVTSYDVEADILRVHDSRNGTTLLTEATSGNLVLCNRCHSDPVLGVTQNTGASTSLSSAMHTFHADQMNRPQVPTNQCESCHPGPVTQCQRGAMAQAGIACADCHGTMAEVGDPARTPWLNMPQCESCHTAQLVRATIKHIDTPNANLTAGASDLYRNSKAHGGGGIYCEACHGSTHAVYPSLVERDNEQSIRLQGHAGMINDCTVCHSGRPEGSFFHFGRGD